MGIRTTLQILLEKPRSWLQREMERTRQRTAEANARQEALEQAVENATIELTGKMIKESMLYGDSGRDLRDNSGPEDPEAYEMYLREKWGLLARRDELKQEFQEAPHNLSRRRASQVVNKLYRQAHQDSSKLIIERINARFDDKQSFSR